MKLFFTVILLLITSICFSQKHNVYFLKDDGMHVGSVDSADYIRIVSEPDSGSNLYNVQEFYRNGKKKLMGKSSAIDPPRYEDQCVTFDHNGKKKSIIQYKNGHSFGNEYYFFPSGRIFRVIAYPNKIEANADIDNIYSIKESYDSLGTAMVVNGNGYFKGYAADSTETYEEGQVKGGKRDGVWKGSVKELHVTFVENYVNGTLLAGTATYDDGQSVTYSQRLKQTDFKGSVNEFSKFLMRNIHYPAEARERDVQGRVIVGFVVEKTGKITQVKVYRSAASSLDTEAVRVMNSSPLWIPAMRFGRAVRIRYAVPIAFTLSE